MTNIKILVAYHKRDALYRNDVLVPVHCGRALVAADDPDWAWYRENLVGDDTGDNISTWNRGFCELTALYWAWKNPDLLGGADFIGLAHYRRLWYLADDYPATTGSILDQIALNPENVHKLVAEHPVVLPRCYQDPKMSFREYQRFAKLNPEQHPMLFAGFARFEEDHRYYHGNMFILPREVFADYCEKLFGVLVAAKARIDPLGQKVFTRYYGYAAEYLTSFYLMQLLEQKRFAAKELPVVFLDLPRAIKL